MLSALALGAYLLAFAAWAPLVILAPGLLALSLHGLSLGRKCLACALWGLLLSAIFHLWTLPQDPALWCAITLVRGPLWAAFPLPEAALRRWTSHTPLKEATSAAAGLGLVTLLLLLGPSGLDWETPGAALTAYPWLLSTLPWLGLAGLSAVLAFCSVLLLCRKRAWTLFGGLALTCWAFTSALLFPKQTAPFPLPVALLQTGWDETQKWASENRERARRRLSELTQVAALQGAAVVVWPETAWPLNSLRQLPDQTRIVSRLAVQEQVEILASSLEEGPQGWYNSVTQVSRTGRLAFEYRKRRLLPFEEYLPLPAVLAGPIRKRGWIRAACHYLPGTEDVVFQSENSRFAVLICYESTVPWAVQRYGDSVDFFVIVTNDAPLQSEWAKEAHFRSAILRAAQFRKPVLQSANTGVTGYIDERGVVLKRTAPDFSGPATLLVP